MEKASKQVDEAITDNWQWLTMERKLSLYSKFYMMSGGKGSIVRTDPAEGWLIQMRRYVNKFVASFFNKKRAARSLKFSE